MDNTLGLTQTLKTEQTLSPQMLQSLALLPMPILELKAHIQEEIERNPALEIPDSEFSSFESLSGPEKSLDDRMDDADSSDYEAMSFDTAPSSGYQDSDYDSFPGSGGYDPEASDRKQQMIENSGAEGETLKEHLLRQLGETVSGDRSFSVGEMLIGNLDQNGFYILPLEQLFDNTDFSDSEIGDGVRTVQSFDPAGICVPDFRASLILQASMSGLAGEDLKNFTIMVNQYLEKLKAGKLKDVAAALRIPEEDVETLYSILRSLTPYPGQNYSSDAVSHVVPDITVRKKDGTLVLDLNRTEIPELVIADGFESLADGLKGPEAKEAASYIRESVRQAKTLINQVNLRFQTLYKAALAIMEYQQEFFLNGPRFLRTMTLRDIADRIGVHETTMSRLAQSKWVDTDWGLFQMKYFFTQGVQSTSDGSESVSRNVVKDMIAEIVAENGALSDQKISDILLSRGIRCARRTVGKYRGELNIDSSYSR